MPIPIPISRTKIATAPWGIPITNETNRLTAQSDADHAAIAALQAATAVTPWTNMVLLNGWVAFDVPRTPQYRKVGDVVYIRGTVKDGGSNSPIWAIPTGFRSPTGRSAGFVVNSSAVTSIVTMDATTHHLQWVGATPGYAYLEGIFWHTS